MRDDDPRRNLDDFAQALVEKLRREIERTITSLMPSDFDMARAQVDILEYRTIRGLKTSGFEDDIWIESLSKKGMPEERILEATRVVIAALEETYAEVREVIKDHERTFYEHPDEDGPAD